MGIPIYGIMVLYWHRSLQDCIIATPGCFSEEVINIMALNTEPSMTPLILPVFWAVLMTQEYRPIFFTPDTRVSTKHTYLKNTAIQYA